MHVTKTFLAALFLLIPLESNAQMANGQQCGNPHDSPGKYGPFDYRAAPPAQRHLVEDAHFTPYIQDLALNGFTSLKPRVKEEFGSVEQVIGGNFDYTLYAFPNHPQALYAMGLWQLKSRDKSVQDFQRMLTGSNIRPAECYFLRALLFKPDDAQVRQVFGIFLHKAKALQRAEEQYLAALDLAPDSAEAHYNLGLLYVDMGKYDQAARESARAKELGYPLKGLQRKLERLAPGE